MKLQLTGDVILGVRAEVSQGHTSHYSVAALKSGKQKAVLWKTAASKEGGSGVDEISSGMSP